MSESQISSDGLDLLFPEEQAGRFDVVELNFDFGEGPVSATEVAIGASVSDVTTKVKDGSDVVFAGKAQKQSTITFKKSKTQDSSSILRLENTLNEEVTLQAKKGTTVDLTIAEGKFRRSEANAGKGKQDDSVTVGSSAKLIASEFNLRKGDDTFTITGGAKLKKKTTVDLGKGGTDTVNIGDGIKGKGKLIVENMDGKRDTLTYGGQSFTRQDIEDGVDGLPGNVELG